MVMFHDFLTLLSNTTHAFMPLLFIACRCAS